ncbi:MAG TPA: tRNA lysidine(34) synthetase TilS [Burkholderiales bacterium]|nr:tRNA lysidine(34) synthetase TilS [Burkholderiales bacterium]
MASTRKSRSSSLQGRGGALPDGAAARLPGHVATQLRRAGLTPGASLLVGLSGGVDSVVLLNVLRGLAPALRFSLRALHVNHGISPNAGEWQAFCERLCRELGVPFAAERVDIAPYRALGLEGAARQARHEALAAHAGVDDAVANYIVLAQHRDDQAETLLLQLARGAGPRGLAGMPAERAVRGTRARLLRPLLDVPRAVIAAFARERGLAWVEDESNADTRLRRNFLRADILPAMERVFPGAARAMAASAQLLGDAAGLLDRLADEDMDRLVERQESARELPVAGLRGLGEARARNLLRRWIEAQGLPWPGLARLNELLRQLLEARGDARVDVQVQGWAFRRYRGVLRVARVSDVQDATDAQGEGLPQSWSGQTVVPFPGLGGVLRFKPEEGRGLSVERLRSAPVTLRRRSGGERLRLAPGRPQRTLKNLFQEGGVPPWERERLPLVYCGDALVAVPGIGEACEWRAARGERGLIVTWERLGP